MSIQFFQYAITPYAGLLLEAAGVGLRFNISGEYVFDAYADVFADILVANFGFESSWFYGIRFGVQVNITDLNLSQRKSFKGLPRRYDFGHVSFGLADGTVSDEVLRYENQYFTNFGFGLGSAVPRPTATVPDVPSVPASAIILPAIARISGNKPTNINLQFADTIRFQFNPGVTANIGISWLAENIYPFNTDVGGIISYFSV